VPVGDARRMTPNHTIGGAIPPGMPDRVAPPPGGPSPFLGPFLGPFGPRGAAAGAAARRPLSAPGTEAIGTPASRRRARSRSRTAPPLGHFATCGARDPSGRGGDQATLVCHTDATAAGCAGMLPEAAPLSGVGLGNCWDSRSSRRHTWRVPPSGPFTALSPRRGSRAVPGEAIRCRIARVASRRTGRSLPTGGWASARSSARTATSFCAVRTADRARNQPDPSACSDRRCVLDSRSRSL
jgi:hypothetical protein